MDLTRYADAMTAQLLLASEGGGDEARAIAERLARSLDSALRLVLLEALSEAAGEITRELAPGSVEVRLRGRDPEFVVTSPDITGDAVAGSPPAFPAASLAEMSARGEAEEGATARITLRMPEQLKTLVEHAAASASQSVNSWLVHTVAEAVSHHGAAPPRAPHTGDSGTGQRFTGWVR